MNLEHFKINLVKDTINQEDLKKLSDWLLTNPRLTKGNLTVEFEKQWSTWQNCKYSVFVNSGSSANLAMLYALMLSKRLKNQKIVFPALSWVTTVSPAIQLGLLPILCDTDKNNLGVDIEHLERIFKFYSPAVLMIVNVLGFPNKMDSIIHLCKKYDVILLEDSCESVGSTYRGTKTGNFGLMSSFSTYFGHHFSTIEGGLVVTDDEELYHILLSIRSHGWSRDLPIEKHSELRDKYNISEFRDLYTFYYPGFNLRSTDLQAFLGLEQLKRLDITIQKRNENYNLYNQFIKNVDWKVTDYPYNYISNFAYPIAHKNIDNLAKILLNHNIEVRPLVCGSIAEQPFWQNLYGKENHLPNAYYFHHNGMYIPNHQSLTEREIEYVSELINKNI